MRAAPGGAVEADPRSVSIEASGLRVHWTGFAFMRGHASGDASLERFAARAATDGVGAAAAELRGLYLALVEDPRRRETCAFVDPSGFFHAFRSPAGAGDDLLALARAGRCTTADLDPESAAELVTQGQVAFGRTTLRPIRRIGAAEIVRLPWSAEAPAIMEKTLPALWTPPGRGLSAQLEQLAPALAGRRISLDLTGGLDSRLLAVALSALGVEFETATVGAAGSEDVRLAARVAAAMGCAHHATLHDPGALPAELDSLLTGSGCQVDPLTSQRELQLQRARAARGVDLVLHGAGGEGLKDFFWQQDFPRYRAARADLRRLWRMRIERPGARSAPLAGAYGEAAARLTASTVERLEAYRVPGNTTTYDRIYFEVRSRDVAGRALTLRSRIVPTYAPFADLDVQRLAYSLPRRTRAFAGLHRRRLTALAPDIARLPTTDAGMTGSSAGAAIPGDAVRWAGARTLRLAGKLGPAALRRPSPESPLPPLVRVLRTMPELDAAVQRLRAEGILRPDATADGLADGHAGGVVALARLLEELDRRA